MCVIKGGLDSLDLCELASKEVSLVFRDRANALWIGAMRLKTHYENYSEFYERSTVSTASDLQRSDLQGSARSINEA